MDYMIKLEELLQHENMQVRTTTQMIMMFVDDVQTGQLTKDEFDELVNDLTNLELIDDLSESIEDQAALASAFESLKTALKALPFV